MSVLSQIPNQISTDSVWDSACASRAAQGDTLFETCKIDQVFLQSAIAPFELIAGGLLSVVFWGVISLCIYRKYGNALLALLVGVPVIMGFAVFRIAGADIYITILLSLAVAIGIFLLIWKIPRD